MTTTTTKPATIRPAVKWNGNKFGTKIARRVQELLAPYLETHLYVEPFTGAGGMACHLKPKRALLNDTDAVVMGLHRWIRDALNDERVKLDFPTGTGEDHYYTQRLVHNGLVDELWKAPGSIDGDPTKRNQFYSRMIWLTRNSFNGLYRQSKKSGYNVPYGKRDKTPNIDLKALSELYQGWELHQGDFESVASTKLFQRSDVALYCDPPYFGTESGYTVGGFSWADQQRLAHWLASLDCPVVASNSCHPEIERMYADLGFTIERIEVKRCMAPKGEQRGAVVELLMYKGV